MRRKSRTGSSPLSPHPSLRRLIDGYNLLYAIGFGNIGTPAAKLPAARQELLDFLTRVLDEPERRATVIVFDAKRAPYGHEPTQSYSQLTIHFAAAYRDADELLIELIRSHPTPRQLEVITSDHSIQVVAQRRRAQFMDSEVWYERITARKGPPRAATPSQPPPHHATAEQDSAPLDSGADPAADEPRPSPAGPDLTNPFPPGYAADIVPPAESWHPFPPGYGEDVDEHNLPQPPRRRKPKRK